MLLIRWAVAVFGGPVETMVEFCVPMAVMASRLHCSQLDAVVVRNVKHKIGPNSMSKAEVTNAAGLQTTAGDWLRTNVVESVTHTSTPLLAMAS